MGILEFPFVLKAANAQTYFITETIGQGAFGLVMYGRSQNNPKQNVAVKRIVYDARYKNRECEILLTLHHKNVVTLLNSFYSDSFPNVYLNLVFEYIPESLYDVIQGYVNNRVYVPLFLVKLYTYQIFRALEYIHELGICHRDVKPHNILVDSKRGIVKLCDFGSAKMLHEDEESVSYICSRFYRAPELLLSATHYTNAIDIWSAGCVFAELLLGNPLFEGPTSVKQMISIIGIIGVPSPEQVRAMNPQYPVADFPVVSHIGLSESFRSSVPQTAIELLSKLFSYDPSKRPRAIEVMAHPYFDEVKMYSRGNYCLPSKLPFPKLLDFTESELCAARNCGVLEELFGKDINEHSN